MKKYLIGLLLLVGVIGITSVFGASSLENTMLIEQLKKDKSLQEKVKAEYQKTKPKSDTNMEYQYINGKKIKMNIDDNNVTKKNLILI